MDDPLAGLVRRADPDRFFCTLFAPVAVMPALLTLYAFNHELARAHEAAREPGLALIRLQWWREVVEGARRRHEVATPLAGFLADGTLRVEDLQAMLDAREQALDPPTTRAGFLAMLLQGPGSLAVAAGRLLGADEGMRDRLAQLGAGYGLAGVLRNLAAGVGQGGGGGVLPADLPQIGGIALLVEDGRALLGAGEPVERGVIAAALPAVLGRRDLRRAMPVARPRDLADRMAVVWAAFRSRA